MPKEKNIVAAILRALRERGYWAVKLHGGPYQVAGLPDVLAIKDGRAAWVEVKQPGERATPIQEATIEKLRQAGCLAFVATSANEVIETLQGT